MQVVVGAVCSPQEFAENLKLDFSAIVRKKGSIDYLPWAEIVRTLHQKVSGCTYGFKEAADGSIIHYTPDKNAYLRPYLTRIFFGTDKDGLPFPALTLESPAGFFPISNMASRHKAMANPDIRAIDNCLRRAIAKEIGVHTGIGLQLWASQDPYDDVEDESAPPAARGAAPAPRPAKAPEPKREAEPVPSGPARRDKAAEVSGLTDHGKKTVAMAVRADSWEAISNDKDARIIQILGDADHVKLLNAGKNTQGKTINPKGENEEVKELVEAFKAAAPA